MWKQSRLLISQSLKHKQNKQLVRLSCRFKTIKGRGGKGKDVVRVQGRSKATDNWPPRDIFHSDPRPRARAPLSIEYDHDQFHYPTRMPVHKKKHDWLLKLLGYYSLTEVRHRGSLYLYRKSCLMSEHKLFWDSFFLEDTFRVELQVLAVHMWLIKQRCQTLEQPEGAKISKQAFWAMFEDLCYRYERHIVGLISKWEKDCQTIIFNLCLSLDAAQEDFPEDPEAYAKACWENFYLSNKKMQYDILYLWSEYIERESKFLQVVEDRDFILGYWEFGWIPNIEDLLLLRKLLKEREDLGITGPHPDPTKTYFGLYDIPTENRWAVPDDVHSKESITCFFEQNEEERKKLEEMYDQIYGNTPTRDPVLPSRMKKDE